VEVQIAQKISSLQPAVRDHFLIDRHWAWALQNAMSKSPTEFSPDWRLLALRLSGCEPHHSGFLGAFSRLHPCWSSVIRKWFLTT